MRVVGRLGAMQVRAESLMTLTLTPQIPTGAHETVGGFEVPAFTAQSTHAGKVQAGSQAGQDTATRSVTVGGVDRPVLAGGLHIPISAPVPVASEQRGIGWEYVVTATGDADPALLGMRFLVVGVPVKSYATARRLDVIEVN